mgnify:CR=1 FL=1
MKDNRFAGLLLILSPIVIIISAALNPHGFGDWADTRALLGSLGGNPGLTSVAALIYTLGFILFAAGFFGIKDSMFNGSNARYMNLAGFFVIVGTAGSLIEGGLVVGAGGAAAAPEGRGMATAIALITGAEGIGTLSTCAVSIGFALSGISILIERNYHIIIGGLTAVIGIFVLYAASDDYYSNLTQYAITAWLAMSLIIGVYTILQTNKNTTSK